MDNDDFLQCVCIGIVISFLIVVLVCIFTKEDIKPTQTQQIAQIEKELEEVKKEQQLLRQTQQHLLLVCQNLQNKS